MKYKKIAYIFVMGLITIINGVNAQSEFISEKSVNARMERVDNLSRNTEKIAAEEFARKNGIPVRVVEPDGRIKEIIRLSKNGFPEYLTTYNVNAAKTISTNILWDSVDYLGNELDGKGIVAAIWDGGQIRTNHIEFGSRVYSADGGFEIVGHATHVAGTIGASGIDIGARGMARKVTIEGYDWDNDNSEMQNAAVDGLLLSNHSYGFIHGFDYNSEEGRWEWYGNSDISETEDYRFGFYGNDAKEWDRISFENPHYLIVKSAGNDRLEGPGPGGVHYIWDNGWKASNRVREKDGGPDGFDCIGSQGTSKNILTVGAVKDMPEGYTNSEDVVITDFSVYGPTDDGRIKPDIVANGEGLYSPYYTSYNSYSVLSGTSMSAPSVTGSLALLQQLNHARSGTYLPSATLKALLFQTADDAGNIGPDYRFGWGLMNTLKIAEFLIDRDSLRYTIIEDTILSSEQYQLYLYLPEAKEVKATMSWTDPPGKVPAVSLDPQDTILVNDLDLRITDYDENVVFFPFSLDPDHPDQQASKADNFRDNAEQIHFAGTPGFYRLQVNHKKESLEGNKQGFSLVLGDMYPVTVALPENYLSDANGRLEVTSAPVVPPGINFSWLIQPENGYAVNLSFEFFSIDAGETVRIFDGSDNNAPMIGEFSGTLFNPDTIITAGGGKMFIEYTTLDNTGSAGFVADYCTTGPVQQISIEGANFPCVGSEQMYLISGKEGIQYDWLVEHTDGETNFTNSESIELSVSGNELQLYVQSYNYCGTGPYDSMKLNPAYTSPDISGPIIGDTLPCVNELNLYQVEDSDDAKYDWLLPDSWAGASDSAEIFVLPVKGEERISVVPYNDCGSSDTISVFARALELPGKPRISTDRVSPCENSEQHFRIKKEPGISYKWEADAFWTLIGSDTTAEVLMKVGQGNGARLFVTASNKCGDTVTYRDFFFSEDPSPPELLKQESGIKGYEELVLSNFDDYTNVVWILNDSIHLGEDENSLIISRNGVYGVEVANSEGCTRFIQDEEQMVFNDMQLEVNIIHQGNGRIRIINESGSEATVSVYNSMGNLLFTDEIPTGVSAFSIDYKGVIVCRIRSAEGEWVKKLVIL